MRARHLVAALALLPQLAAAEPRKVLVLQSEGRAEPALRTRIDAAITRLAGAAQLQASTGELTFTDAAVAVGCKPQTVSCRNDVLAMLAVDEIVITTVTPRPGGVEIAVHRIAKGGAERDATMLLPTGAAVDRLDGIAPLFGDRPPAAAPPAAAPAGAAPTAPAPAAPPAQAIAPSQPAEPAPVVPAPTAVELPPPAVPETASPTGPAPPSDQPGLHDRRLEIAGMAGGAGMMTLGLILWGAASGTQDDINQAPTRTQKDLANLKDLESRGDVYAAVGNVLVATGAVVGGLATYLFLKDRRAASTQAARLSPTVIDHGAGLVLTIGGMP